MDARLDLGRTWHVDQDAFCLSHRLWDGVVGVDDFEVAEATYRAAVARWPTARITLRQAARVVHDAGPVAPPHQGAWPARR